MTFYNALGCSQLFLVPRQKDNVHAFLGVSFGDAERDPTGPAG